MPSTVLEFEPDCNDVGALRVMVIVLSVAMFLQTVMGVVARTVNRMYPYLFVPMKDGGFAPIRLLRKLLRLLGP